MRQIDNVPSDIRSLIRAIVVSLTHLCLEFHKRDTGKQCIPIWNGAEDGVWSGSTVFALYSWIPVMHDNSDAPDIEMNVSK